MDREKPSIRQRDGHSWQVCITDKYNTNTDTYKDLEVHHSANIEDYSKRLDSNNLITQ